MTHLRLHLNEHTAGCSPAVIDAIRSVTREELAIYPDYRPITALVEQHFDVGSGWVLLTNGLDEGLHFVAQRAALTSSPRSSGHALIVEPAFEMYAACAGGVGLDVVRVISGDDLAFPVEGVLAAIKPDTRLIYVTDPGNPTGLGIPPGAILRMAQASPHALLFVDEAYAEFSGRTCIGELLATCRNIVVGRTFAKAYGLAGLRVGAIVAHPATLDPMRRAAPPFSFNVCAIKALAAAIGDRAYVDWYLDQAAQSRELIYAFCRLHDWPFWPSETNFVLMRAGNDAPALVAALAQRGILIRDRSSAPACAGCIRITAGVVEHTVRCLTALEDVLASRNR